MKGIINPGPDRGIEADNRKLTELYCTKPETNEVNKEEIRINEKLKESVQEHRRINGITHRFSILRSLVRTRGFVRTIKVA